MSQKELENARDEFVHHVNKQELLAALVYFNDGKKVEKEKKLFTLYRDFTVEEKEEFLNNLNFNYDSGWGSQKLFGTIWYKDGTFSERSEYDGSEWWTHYSCPPVPERPTKE